jgi:hypothetical protein
MHGTKITVECLVNSHFDLPNKMQEYIGFTEETLMMQIMAGATGLLQHIGIREHIEHMKFEPIANPNTLAQCSVEVRCRIIARLPFKGEEKADIQFGIHVVRDTERRDEIVTIGRLGPAIMMRGMREARTYLRKMEKEFDEWKRELRSFAPFAFSYQHAG